MDRHLTDKELAERNVTLRYEKPGILLVSQLYETRKDVAAIALDNIIDLLLRAASAKILVVTGSSYDYAKDRDSVRVTVINQATGRSFAHRVVGYLVADLRTAFNLLKRAKQIQMAIYHYAKGYPVSMLVAKFLRKSVILSSFSVLGRFRQIPSMYPNLPGGLYFTVIELAERVCFALADQIWVESEAVVDFGGLDSYWHKIAICGAHYVDTNKFKILQEMDARELAIGYLGRVAFEKGIMQLIEAVPSILMENRDLMVLIGGDGPLQERVRTEIEKRDFLGRVKLLGPIPHGQVPQFLNRLRLLVVPSYTEGLPSVIQEAMACGVVVLACPVGGIPDLVEDGKTGFIMHSNSPELISLNTVRAMRHPNLAQIAENARELIEREYSYDVMVRKWMIVLGRLQKTRELGHACQHRCHYCLPGPS